YAARRCFFVQQWYLRCGTAVRLTPGSRSIKLRDQIWPLSAQESPMSVARHPRPPELEGVPIETIMARYVGRFREKKPDWAASEDAKIEGYKRAQHRFIGAGGSGKHNDPTVIPAG